MDRRPTPPVIIPACRARKLTELTVALEPIYRREMLEIVPDVH
jgi:hypothetical protein